jgi:hypothetical protein
MIEPILKAIGIVGMIACESLLVALYFPDSVSGLWHCTSRPQFFPA